jgi:hypothetical protein
MSRPPLCFAEYLPRLIDLLRAAGTIYLRAVVDLIRHNSLPGYNQLPWWTRRYIDARSLGAFVCSRQCARLALWLTAWLLASYLLVWRLDLQGPAAAAPPLLALLWLLPWVAHARRREVARLLRYRWPA